jgi:uncharacterized protein YecE (DUF72 family)
MGELDFVIGTSGFSFADWVGPFYPPGTGNKDMLRLYAQHFRGVELNYTFYAMPSIAGLESLASKTPPDFTFWVKANRELTHRGNLEPAGPFVEAMGPLADRGRLAGILIQLPQSFHRTDDNRQYLARLLDAMAGPTLAVEFRHASWEDPAAEASLRERQVALVVPDVPPIGELYHHEPVITGPVGYTRLHSRNADKWYKGEKERYDYLYSHEELQGILGQWRQAAGGGKKVYAFFNNCHRAQAAQNAEAFQRLLEQEG